MSNSRLKLKADDDKPHNSSKGKGIILETPYKPGFVDDKDLETVKMALDKELSEISNAFYQTTERTADTITRIDSIEIGSDGLLAKIEEVDKVSREGDVALASRLTTISAEVGDNKSAIITESVARASADEVMTKRVDTILGSMQGDLGPLVGQFQEQIRVLGNTDGILADRITNLSAEYKTADGEIKASVKAEETARVSGDQALASQITTVKTQLDKDIASVQTYASTEITKVDGKTNSNAAAINTVNAKWGVTVDVNGNIAGVELNNGSKGSEFKVKADRFYFTDGTSSIPPFAVSGGTVYMNNVVVRGTLYAQDVSGDMGTEWRLSTNDISPQTNVWFNWHSFRILNARPYARQVIFDSGMVTNGNLVTGEGVFNIRLRHENGTIIASGGV
ncbi:MAG: phage tail tip fiber protein, partial [Bacteroidales bacterium]